MSKCMSLQELDILVKYITINHSPELITEENINLGWKQVVYFQPKINFRTMTCSSVLISGSDLTRSFEVEIHTMNECRMLPDSLYDRIINFLQSKTEDIHVQNKNLEARALQVIEYMTGAKITDLDKDLTEFGADSLDCVEIVIGLEEEFDITIDDEDASKLRTANEFTQLARTLVAH